MSINPLRVRQLNTAAFSNGIVVYHMCRELRAHDNEALLFAQSIAREHGAELIVNYTVWNYLWNGATRRFYDWVIPSLQEVERVLRAHNIPLIITFETKEKHSIVFNDGIAVGAVIVDQSPFHFMQTWKATFLQQHKDIPLYEVDAHNVIPVWELSPKQEFAAHTIRRKVHEKIGSFLETYGKLSIHTENAKLITVTPLINWADIKETIRCREHIAGTGGIVPGEQAAKGLLSSFLKHKLLTYGESRNTLNEDGQSNLSPYISHGNLSRRRIVLDLLQSEGIMIQDAMSKEENGSNGKQGSIAAFLEECVVRAELSENFCFYNPQYDSYEGFPNWAKETLDKASTDKRDYVYTLAQFEQAETHDDLWNAAQMQMVKTGKMHGYMRMYWAKKILEWSKNAKEAMKIAVYLNDTYELDGRESGGYVGCGWSIGGVHDRPWFGRPIFGAIRYMARSGVEKRGSAKIYIETWGEK